MLTSVVVALAIFVFGARIADTLRLRAEESILRKLPLSEAHAYYEVLRRRARKTKLLRAVTLASLLLVLMAARRRLFNGDDPSPGAPRGLASAPARDVAPSTLTTTIARERAEAATRRHLPPALPAAALRLEGVSSDAAHPWIFDFSAGPERLRAYVTVTGQVEVLRRLDESAAPR